MSFFKTSAAKRKTSVKQVAESLKLEDGSYGIHYQMKGEERTLKLFRLKTWKRPHGDLASVDKEPKVAQYTLARSELIRRLNASQCEYCETQTGPFEVHHVRGLKSIRVGKGTVATDHDCRHRKTWFCNGCDRLLTAGKLPPPEVLRRKRWSMESRIIGNDYVRFGGGMPCYPSYRKHAAPCGTVLVECKKQGIPSVGIEASPMAQFASQVKVDWSLEPEGLMEHARHVAASAIKVLSAEGIEDNPLFRLVPMGHLPLKTLSDEKMKLLLANSLSPLPLHKTLVLLDCLEEHHDERYDRHERLALAKALAFSISNLHFGPEVGLGAVKLDAPVISAWLDIVQGMANDLYNVQVTRNTLADVYLADSRQISEMIEPHSIDAVITSPPYPNEKDYTRTTRLESVLLGFIQDKAELQALKRSLLCSNTRNVYKDDMHDQLVAGYAKIQQIAEAIEAKRIELGKTSGFERLYARATRLYFGGMVHHLTSLRTLLRPGAQLAYVVGDQASYFRIKRFLPVSYWPTSLYRLAMK